MLDEGKLCFKAFDFANYGLNLSKVEIVNKGHTVQINLLDLMV